MQDSTNRRAFLKRAGATGALVTTGLAGCTGGNQSNTETTEETTTKATTTSQMTTTTSKSTGSSGDEYTIGFQVGGLKNSWFTALAKAGKWYGEANGMNVNIGDGELNPTTQVKVARNLINSGVDALIVNPFDSEAMAKPVNEAAKKGIPTFSVDSVATSPKLKQYTAFGNFSAGKRAAENAVKLLEKKKGEKKGKLVEVMIEQSAKLGVSRHEGTVAGIKEYDNVALVGHIVTNNTRQDAATKVFNFLQRNPDVDGFVCHAVTVGNGTLNALERHDMKVPEGKKNHKIISQIDAGPSTLKAIRNGYVGVAIDQPVHFYGPVTMHYIKKYLDAGKDDSVLPSIGDTVKADAFTLTSDIAQKKTGQNIWERNTWALAKVEKTDAVDNVPWFHTNSVKVTEDNVDAPYLWGNWIKEV